MGEQRRAGVLARVESGELTLVDAAVLMGMSYRQSKRLAKRYREGGTQGLKHSSAGRESNRRKAKKFRERVLRLVGKKYSGEEGERFGPTLAAEQLARELTVLVCDFCQFTQEAASLEFQKRQVLASLTVSLLVVALHRLASLFMLPQAAKRQGRDRFVPISKCSGITFSSWPSRLRRLLPHIVHVGTFLGLRPRGLRQQPPHSLAVDPS